MKNNFKEHDKIKELNGLFAAPLIYFDQTSSVLDEAARLIKVMREAKTENMPTETVSAPMHGTVLLTSHQTKGRGQRGKHWHTQPNAALLLAVLFEALMLRVQNASLTSSPLMTLCVASTLAKLLLRITHNTHQVHIKWPNDVLVDNKKISGILTETYTYRQQNSRMQYYAVGLGLNILQPVLDTEVDADTYITKFRRSPILMASSLQTLGIDISITDLYLKFIEILTVEILKPFQHTLDFINDNLWHKNEEIVFVPTSESTSIKHTSEPVNTPHIYNLAKILHICNDGSLELLLTDGSTKKVVSGSIVESH